MKGKWVLTTLLASTLIITGCSNSNDKGKNKEDNDKQTEQASKNSGVTYPKDGVKGIYVSANSTKGEKFDELTKFIEDSDLNAMVIDVKDDSGNVTIFNTGIKEIDKHTLDIVDAKPLLSKMKSKHILIAKLLLLRIRI